MPLSYGRTQKELVLNYLETNPSITPLKARHLFRVERLSEVVRRLKGDGHTIKNIVRSDETGRRYSNYILVGKVN